MAEPLLEVINATKVYRRGILKSKEEIYALQDFNLCIEAKPATITTIAGESGSGKTTLANTILGFTQLTSGKIIFKGNDVSKLNHQQMLDYRRQVQPVFQDPYEVYNPFYRVHHIFDIVLRNFRLAKNRTEARELMMDAMKVVGLRAEEILEKYPHQLSGGQRQRMMMARAYLLKPSLIVADEPVSMVDASLRAMILDTMLRLRDEFNISFVYITHDLSTAYQISDYIYILYQGAVAEGGLTSEVIENPQHPYVQLLIDSIPEPNPRLRWSKKLALSGEESQRLKNAAGCRFFARCPHRMEHCQTQQPPLFRTRPVEHHTACFLYEMRPEEAGPTMSELTIGEK